jgi:hypothetical protein
MTFIFWQLEDNLFFLEIESRPSLCGKIEEDLNIIVNGRQPQYLVKWKTTYIIWQNESLSLSLSFITSTMNS